MGQASCIHDGNIIRRGNLIHGWQSPVRPGYQPRRDLAELCISTLRLTRQEKLGMPNALVNRLNTFKQLTFIFVVVKRANKAKKR